MLHIANAVVVEWLGPYSSLEEIKEDFEINYDCCFYLVTGQLPYQRTPSEIKYIGISKRYVVDRLKDKGHKQNQVKFDTRSYWIGRFSVNKFRDSIRKDYKLLVESCIIRYMTRFTQCRLLNIRQTGEDPHEPIVIINRWYNNNYVNPVPRLRKPHTISDMPDIIMYDGNKYWSSNKLSLSHE